jgi:hypothetical protein
MTTRSLRTIGVAFCPLIVALLVLGTVAPSEARQPEGVVIARPYEIAPQPRGFRTKATPPLNWPQHQPFRPRRHAGPFVAGTDFPDQIKVVLNGSSASWHHNNYFAVLEDAASQDKYRPYYDSALPSDNTPARSDAPGGLPLATGSNRTLLAGANQVLMELDTIFWSSRYGGSVRLLFRASEDYSYEFVRTGTGTDPSVLWDVSELEMSIYVVPEAPYFNPIAGTNPPRFYVGSFPKVYVEFLPGRATAYSYGPAGRSSIVPLPAEDSNLSALLTTLVSGVAGGIGFTATKFTYGFIHDQFQDQVSGIRRVNRIAISDNSFWLAASDRVPFILTDLKIVSLDDCHLGGDDHCEEDSEWFGRVISEEHYGNRVESYMRKFGRPNGTRANEGTPYMNIATWSLAECSALTDLVIKLRVTEVDPVFNDRAPGFETVSIKVEPGEWHGLNGAVPQIGCQRFVNRDGHSDYGIVDEWQLNAWWFEEGVFVTYLVRFSITLR